MFVFINHNKNFFNMVNHRCTYSPICVLKRLTNQYMDPIISIIEYLVELEKKKFLILHFNKYFVGNNAKKRLPLTFISIE